MAIVGGDKRDARFFREANEVAIDILFDWQALVLNFKEKIAFAENILEAVGVFAGLIEALLDDGFGDGAAEAGGESDQTFTVFGEKVVVDAGLVIETFEKTGGDKLDEVAIAVHVFAKEDKVIAAARARLIFAIVAVAGADGSGFLAAIETGTLGEIDLATDDGLNVALTGFMEEVGGGKEVTVVGNGHGGHFLPGSFIEEFGSFARAVEQTEVRVDVQMNKLGIAHGIRL